MEQEGRVKNDISTPPKGVSMRGLSDPLIAPPFYRLLDEPIEAEFWVLFRGMISSCMSRRSGG